MRQTIRAILLKFELLHWQKFYRPWVIVPFIQNHCIGIGVQSNPIISRFMRKKRGTVAMAFAISLVPTIGVMGVAFDYMRAGESQAKLQVAVDSAALAAGASSMTDTNKLATLIDNYIAVNGKGLTGFKVTDITNTTNANNDVIIKVKGTMDTAVMRIFGINQINIGVQTDVSRAKDGRAEIALVLDTTGSMAGSKISTLKTAAKNLIADLLKANDGKTDPIVKIGIVPFAQYVNVGVSRRNESWITVPADYQTSVTTCTGNGKKQKKQRMHHDIYRPRVSRLRGVAQLSLQRA